MKEHKKMYKSGKSWIVATLAVATISVVSPTISSTFNVTAHAANIPMFTFATPDDNGWLHAVYTDSKNVLHERWVYDIDHLHVEDEGNGNISWEYSNAMGSDPLSNSANISSLRASVASMTSQTASQASYITKDFNRLKSTYDSFMTDYNYLSSVAKTKGLPADDAGNPTEDLEVLAGFVEPGASAAADFAGINGSVAYANSQSVAFDSNASAYSATSSYSFSNDDHPIAMSNVISACDALSYAVGNLSSDVDRASSAVATYYYEYYAGDSDALDDAYIRVTGSSKPGSTNTNNGNTNNGNNTDNTNNGNNTDNTNNGNNTDNTNNGNNTDNTNNGNNTDNINNDNNINSDNNNLNTDSNNNYYAGFNTNSYSASSNINSSSSSNVNSNSSSSSSNSSNGSSATTNGIKNTKLFKDLSKARKLVLKDKKAVKKAKKHLLKTKTHKAKEAAKHNLNKSNKAYQEELHTYNKLLKEYRSQAK